MRRAHARRRPTRTLPKQPWQAKRTSRGARAASAATTDEVRRAGRAPGVGRRRREERATIRQRGYRRAPPDRSPQPPWLPGQPPRVPGMERNLAMELVRVTEAAALASARLMGRGDEMAADVAAIEAMRTAFDAIAIDGTVVIGEGAEDAMPKLYVGERVGTGQGPATDVALDALEGAAICAAGGYNALSGIAIAEHGTFLRVPDTYMDKIACGPEGRGAIDLDQRPRDNLKALADV